MAPNIATYSYQVLHSKIRPPKKRRFIRTDSDKTVMGIEGIDLMVLRSFVIMLPKFQRRVVGPTSPGKVGHAS
jgi:hypothetical protein